MSNYNLIRLPSSIEEPVPDLGLTTTTTTTTANAINPLEPLGLTWPENDKLSNAKHSQDAVLSLQIVDFTKPNPYIHYDTTATAPILFYTGQFLTQAQDRFELYKRQFRNPSTWPEPRVVINTTLPPPPECASTELVAMSGGRYGVYCLNVSGVRTKFLGYT